MILIELTKLYTSLFLAFFVPGYFLMRAIFSFTELKEKVSAIEKLVITFGLSVASVNFLVIIINHFDIPITALSSFLVITIFSFLFFLVEKFFEPKKSKADTKENKSPLQRFSKKQIYLFLTIFVFAVVVRSFYVAEGIVPETTDLGHHMYWSKYIADFGELPNYGMPDFIIGEHIVFAVVILISGISFVSAVPVISLLLINLFSLLAIFLVTFRIAENFTSKKNAKLAALFSLFVIGTFYAISSPQTKFISGGVIGNLIGNFYIPFLFYSFLSALKFKSKNFAALFVLSSATLVFTHHLSTFVFLFVFAGFLASFLALLLIFYKVRIKEITVLLWKNISLFFSAKSLFFILLIALIMFFVWMPSYLNPEAVDTAVGTPTKSTRTGFPLGEMILNAGPWRFFYSGVSAIFVAAIFVRKFFKKRKSDSFVFVVSIAVIFSWFAMIFLMSTHPELLKIDIPSNRIVSYFTFPVTILSSIATILLLSFFKKRFSKNLALLLFVMVVGTGVVSGLANVSDAARGKEPNRAKEVMETYVAGEYLAEKIPYKDKVLKDHIYLSGDTWLKIFFMQDYKYPLSRSLLKRYEDPVKKRETCTRDMVAIPDSEVGQKCFKETGVKYVVLKKGYDTAQFEKSKNFSKVYISDSVVIFKRN